MYNVLLCTEGKSIKQYTNVISVDEFLKFFTISFHRTVEAIGIKLKHTIGIEVL